MKQLILDEKNINDLLAFAGEIPHKYGKQIEQFIYQLAQQQAPKEEKVVKAKTKE